MSNEKLGTEPAFGYPAHTDINDEPGYGRLSNTHNEEKGMSKRLWIATHVTTMLYPLFIEESGKNPELNTKEVVDSATVSMAYSLADELLKQENE